MGDSDSKDLIDENWDINKQVIGAGSVCVRPSCDKSHTNIYIHRSGQENSHIEIPKTSVEISDTKYGVRVG